MSNFNPKSDKSRVRRIPKRGQYDEATIYEILDSDCVCNVGFNYNGYPVIIPTIYGRSGNKLYLHGATTSRMLETLSKGENLCISVTHVNGIVLARSLFHSSMNYKSVVIFGSGKLLPDSEKMDALKIVSDQIIPGRWEEARLPSQKELKATNLIEIEILEASAKIREGHPGDDKVDYDLDIWAGVIPLTKHIGEPIPDPLLKPNISLPDSAKSYVNSNKN